MRPETLDDLVGQEHLTGRGSILRTSIEQGKVPSMILWGPPGVGKTTIANIIAHSLRVPYFQLSAISSGVKEVREVIEEAKQQKGTILFIDEIHRFNKGQQDALLGVGAHDDARQPADNTANDQSNDQAHDFSLPEQPGKRRYPAEIKRPVAPRHRFNDANTMRRGSERFPAGRKGRGRESGISSRSNNCSGSQRRLKQPRATAM